ncbi:hypothetical protein NDU88_005217 [Pleurodeles waltl]|uniref:Uncharacterized protein n=1 Tax=Pleurodeles waltl TaxID=8319 RepID=A0AAV7MVR3_PLEWA|nr:hypothetical protein NDU88_005217 [Pleurodeles waltl]
MAQAAYGDRGHDARSRPWSKLWVCQHSQAVSATVRRQLCRSQDPVVTERGKTEMSRRSGLSALPAPTWYLERTAHKDVLTRCGQLAPAKTRHHEFAHEK